MRQRNDQHFFRCRHFQIERQVRCILNALEIIIANMATVFAKVRGDAIAANPRHNLRRAHRIRMIATTRIADGGNMVDVYAEAEGAGQAARLPGLVTSMAASSSGTSSSA